MRLLSMIFVTVIFLVPLVATATDVGGGRLGHLDQR